MIKNYTSTVTVAKSVQHIEESLVAHGATQILKIYSNDKKRLDGIAFIIKQNGEDISFRLPARINKIEKKFKSGVKRPRKETYKNGRENCMENIV